MSSWSIVLPGEAVARSRLILWLCLLLGITVAGAQEPRFHDEIEVRQAQVTVRVVDGSYQPIRGLDVEDFEVKVDDQVVAPQSVTWIETGVVDLAAPDAQAQTSVIPRGRLIVLFFQLDFERTRLSGLVRMVHHANELIDQLDPQDQVAVVVFGSHLVLHLDFTGDTERLHQVVSTTALFDEVSDPATDTQFSLHQHLDPDAARAAASPESALLVTAKALEKLPGEKSLVFLGWGLGRFSSSGVRMRRSYGPARRSLIRSQTAVFSLDVSSSDRHSLEVGLQRLAHDSGGFYARTHLFPQGVMQQLESALSGYYLLVFNNPFTAISHRKLEVRLTRSKGTVLARRHLEG
jgi:VWFA-related protein